MNERISSLLNEQVTKEFYSAYLYLAISNWFAENDLNGFAAWYVKQAEEEKEHAMKLVGYLHDNGAKVSLGALEAPRPVYADAKEPVAAALEHEKFITASIEAIYTAAMEEKDVRTQIFLQWFITEQVEEEKNAAELLTKVTRFGDTPTGLYHLDADAAARK